MDNIDAFPLCWPLGYPRTRHPIASRFDPRRSKSFADVRDELFNELWRLRASKIILSSNIPVRLDGVPYSGRREPEDSGVAVYFTLKKEQHVIACDKWRTVKENVRGITKSIEALRGLDRWGCTEMSKRAFTGFKALPAPGEASGSKWWLVLGVERTANKAEIRRAYRERARTAHPDTGGTDHSFQLLQSAYEQAMQAAG